MQFRRRSGPGAGNSAKVVTVFSEVHGICFGVEERVLQKNQIEFKLQINLKACGCSRPQHAHAHTNTNLCGKAKKHRSYMPCIELFKAYTPTAGTWKYTSTLHAGNGHLLLELSRLRSRFFLPCTQIQP